MSNTIGSSTVDERIVEMRIDNAKFEAGAKKTIGILESLDRSLKGISEENTDSFDHIGKSLDKVTDRFSAFGIVGDQVMRNLTNRAMEMVSQVKNMTTMLTTQQIGAGWDKYADKTSAIQTIMAATSGKISDGTFADQAEQLAWVNEQIEKLNKFTDETSYNFLDMVGNIGKFTAAGRELEESVTAMEGIANWAAISGGRPAEASRAMYNLSQALGMGKVTQLDWKSIENANMATYEFKQQVIDVAEEMGTLKKIADGIWEDMDGHEVTVESFRENLKDGWFDSDVLLKVLNRYGEFSDVLLNVSDATGKTATEILHQIKAFKETGRVADWLSPYIQELTKDEYELGLRAFQAAQEAKTFTEAIDATKDAVSTKWMTVFELLFGNYLEAKELWTDMAETFWDIFAAPVDRLIEIIENAGGFIGKDGFTGSMEQAAGGTALLESSLQAAGKTMDDFYKALEEHTGSARFKALEFAWGSIEEALKGGAVTAEEFRGALSKLDSSYDTAKTVSLDRALLHAGKTMDDFEKSIMQVGGPAALEMVKNFGSVEEALRQGGVWADLFRQALNNIGIDSENVTQNIEETVQHSVASLEEMRQFALEVLRGDHGNGEERLAWYESMGLDAELMQAMAGNLHHIGQDISDEYLMELMEIYYQAQGLSERLGYATFAEYIASRQEAMEGYVDSMEELASKSEGLYASLFGEGILNEAGEYYSAGELFRKSITNLLDALANFGEAFDKAFMKVFGGSDDEKEQILNMSDGFFTLTAAFYSFSEKIKNFSESETLLNFMTALFSTLQMIGNALSLVFKIGKTGLSFALKLLTPIFTLVSGVFDAISFGIETLSDSFNNSGIPDLIDSIGNDLLAKIAEPIDKINTVISALIDAFREGFSEGGMMGGFDKMMEALDTLFQNHPVFLTIAHTVGQVLIYLGDAISGAALAMGGILGGAITLLIAGFEQLGDWIGYLIDEAKKSELVMGIWNGITETFEKLGNVIRRVFGYAEKGYQEGGFFGALSAIGESLERGIRRLIPGGNALMDLFDNIADVFDDGNSNSSVVRIKKSVNKMRPSFEQVSKLLDKMHDSGALGVRQIERVGDVVEKLEPKITRAAKVVETVSDGMFGDEEAKKTLKERVAAFIQTLWDGVLEGLRKITIKDVIGAMRLSLIASIASSIMGAITIFKDIKNSIKSVPESIAEVGKKFANMMQGLSATFTANAVLKFAVAALLLSFVLAKLAKIPKEDLTHAASTLIVILGVLALLAKGLGQLKMGWAQVLGKLPNMTGVLIGLAGMIMAFASAAVALTVIQLLGPAKFKNAVSAIGDMMTVIILILGVLLVAAKYIEPRRIKAISKFATSMGAAMILIGVAVSVLTGAVAMLTVIQFLGAEKFNKAVSVIKRIIIGMSVLIGILAVFLNKSQPKKIETMGKAIQKIAGSMIIVALAVGMLALPVAMLAVIGSVFKGKIVAAGWTIAIMTIGLAAAIGILIAFLKTEAGSPKKIENIGKTVKKMAWSMFTVAAAVTLMTVPLLLLARAGQKYGVGGMMGAFISLIEILGLMVGMLWLTGKITGNKNGDGILKFAGAMALLSLSVLLLAPAIVILSSAVSTFADKLGKMNDKKWQSFGKGLWRLVGLSAAIAVFGVALIALGLGAGAAGLGFVTVAGGIFLLIAAVSLLMFALPGFIQKLEDLKETSFGELGQSLTKVAIAAVVFMAIFGGLLFMLSRFFKFLSADNLEKTGNGLSKFFKGLVSGAASSTTGAFAKVTQALQDPEKRKAITGAIATIVTIAALYISDLIPTFTQVIIGGIVELIKSIAAELNAQSGPFVDALTELVQAVLGIVKDLVARLFGKESWDDLNIWQKGLADIGGGVLLISKLSGLISFGKATDSAGTLAEKINSVTEKVTSMKTGFHDVKDALGGLAAAIGPVAGSLIVAFVAIAAAAAYAWGNINEQQKILRENAGDPKSLEEYATSIEQVEARIAELEESLLNNGGEGMEMVNEELQAQKILLNSLRTEYDALLQETQNPPIAETRNYAEELHGLGEAWQNASGKEAIDNWQAYTRLLNEGAEVLGITTDELDAMAGGYRQIKESASEAATAAETASAEVANTVNDVSEEVTSGNEAVNKFKENLELLPDELGTWFGGLDIYGVIQEALGNQNIDINDIIKSDGSGIDKEKLASIVNIDKLKSDLSGMMGDAGMESLAGLGLGFEEHSTDLEGPIETVKNSMVDYFLDLLGIESPSRVMADQVGAYIPAGIGAGITEHQYEATTPVIMLVQEMLHTVQSGERFFETCGRNVVVGLANGISNNLQIAYQAGQNVASSVENGFRDKLSIRSPSRVFAELARFIPLGVAEGIDDGSTSAISSVTVLGSALIDAIMGSMAMVSAAADDEFEITPYIRPVVDLSNVKNASGLVNSVFRESYGLSGEIGTSISRRMQQTRLNVASRGESGSTVNSNDNITFNIYATEGMDENAIADAVMERMGSRYVRRGMAFG